MISTPFCSHSFRNINRRFTTFNSDLKRFAKWLHENDCLDVCMESTGKYWVPVFNILEKRDIRVVIANPKWVKAVKGNKDDTKDSKWIGDLFRLGLVKSSFIPSKDISRAGVYLKPALVQVTHAAVKDKLNPYYALKYERIAKRRGKKRAIIAIARMILTAIYSMLSTGEIWNPVDLFKIDMPDHLKEQQLQKAVKQAIRLLEAQGLKVS